MDDGGAVVWGRCGVLAFVLVLLPGALAGIAAALAAAWRCPLAIPRPAACAPQLPPAAMAVVSRRTTSPSPLR